MCNYLNHGLHGLHGLHGKENVVGAFPCDYPVSDPIETEIGRTWEPAPTIIPHFEVTGME